MNLKNYTSEVPVATSMGRIEKSLVEAGATDISKNYKDGICVAIRFRILVDVQPLFFELPARIDACFKVMWKEIKKPQNGTRQKVTQQAGRTACKIISDWVEIQLSMIRLEQAEMLQIFLPYAYNRQTDKTFFDEIKGNGFKALLDNKK